jgi:hypothetical protein
VHHIEGSATQSEEATHDRILEGAARLSCHDGKAALKHLDVTQN